MLNISVIKISLSTYCTFSGVIHEDLRLFLETHIPKSGKKKKSILGVSDSKIAAPISEELGLSCQHTGVVPEIIRGTVFDFLYPLKNVFIFVFV